MDKLKRDRTLRLMGRLREAGYHIQSDQGKAANMALLWKTC